MNNYKLTVIRKDGLSYSSEFSGWHGEIACLKYFEEAKEDKRTLMAVWFVGEVSKHSHEIKWSYRADHIAAR